MSIGAIFGKLDVKAQDGVLDDIGKAGAERYQLYFDTGLKVLGKNDPPMERLAKFRSRPQAVWQAIEQEFPKKFKEQMRDYERLEKTHGASVELAAAMPAPVTMSRNAAAPGSLYQPTAADQQQVLQRAYERSQVKQLETEYAPPKGAAV